MMNLVKFQAKEYEREESERDASRYSRNGTDWRTNTDGVLGGDTELHIARSRPLGIIAWPQSSLARFEAGTNAAQPPLPETLEEQ
jgi:hypothetical protein